MAGLYNDAAGTITFNDYQNNGFGSLDITSGDQGFLTLSGSTTIINETIGDAGSPGGGLAPESSGTLYLNGANTYSGGTTFGYSGSPLVYYNNSASFGTGAIKTIFGGTTLGAILGYGGAPISLPNNFANTGANGSGFNFASSASTPITSTGNWNINGTGTAAAFTIKNNGNSTAPLTLTGTISGSSTQTLAFTGGNGSTTYVSPASGNTYTGMTQIGASGATAITVQAGVANAFGTTSKLLLAGGTFNPGGYNQTIAGPMGMSVSSMIDYGAGLAVVSFTKSVSSAWAGTLNLANWNAATMNDVALQYGTDNTGLTSAQLGEIEFDGIPSTIGSATLDSNGFVVETPEPSTLLLGLGGMGMIWRKVRKTA
jgi:hypothetical protein